MDIVQKSGAWFSYNGERLGQGRENAKQYLKDHQEIAATVDKQIRDASNVSANAAAASFSEDDDSEDDLDLD